MARRAASSSARPGRNTSTVPWGVGLGQPVRFQGPQHLTFQPFVPASRLVVDRDRMAAALAVDHGGTIQIPRQGFQIEGGRHHQQPQLGPQQAAGLAYQRQGQVRFSLTLVEFVEDHAGHSLPGRGRPGAAAGTGRL